jgi:magnesium-transporting ATPase (P-type)
LSKLAKQISRLGYAAAFLVGAVYVFNALVFDSGMNASVIWMKLRDLRFVFETLLNAFTLGLTVVVLAVPEGLPLMISVVLSSNIKKMVKPTAKIATGFYITQYLTFYPLPKTNLC